MTNHVISRLILLNKRPPGEFNKGFTRLQVMSLEVFFYEMEFLWWGNGGEVICKWWGNMLVIWQNKKFQITFFLLLFSIEILLEEIQKV